MPNCSYDDQDLYLDEDTSICYKNCSDNSNSNKYIYQNICVSQCPINYYLEINNTCVFRELLTDININEEEKEEEEYDEEEENKDEFEENKEYEDIEYIEEIEKKEEEYDEKKEYEYIKYIEEIVKEEEETKEEYNEREKYKEIEESKENNEEKKEYGEKEDEKYKEEKEIKNEDEINKEEYLEINEKIDEMNIIIEEEENKNEEIEEKEKEKENNNENEYYDEEQNNNKNEEYEENAEYDNEVNEHEIDEEFSSLKYIEIIESELFPNYSSLDADINSIEENNLKNESLNDLSISLIKTFLEKNSELEIQKLENMSMLYCFSSKSDMAHLINLNKNLTYINLKECEKKLLEENGLDKESELLILARDSPANNLNKSSINNFYYEIYTRAGEKVNKSSCENIETEISSSIKNLDIINYEKALILSEQGYDIFNLSSNFYYDVCTSAYLGDTDLSLSIRQQEIFPNNISLCISGCEYKSIDLENKRFHCKCNSNNEGNDKNFFIEEVKQNFFIYFIDMINYEIVICYQHIFNKDNYFYNFGFYVGFSLLTLIFIFLLIFIFIGRISLRLQYFHKQPKREEIIKYEQNIINKQRVSVKMEMHKKNSIRYKNADLLDKKKNKRKIKSKTSRHYKRIKLENSNSNSIPPIRKKSKKFSRKIKKNQTHINKMNSIKFQISEAKLSKDEMIEHNASIVKGGAFNRNNSFKTITNNNEQMDYFELSYSQALEKDNRSLIRTFISLFNVKLECIQILFFPKEFTHISLTMSLYLFDLLLDLTINAFLFSDDVISQKYFNNGELEFITTNTLSIISNIVTNFILFLIGKLINQYEIMNIITREIKDVNHYYKIYLKLISLFKLKIWIFFTTLFLMGFFCTYYLFIFCSIYKRIQKELFINYLVGSLWSLGFTIVICLMIAISRILAIKKRIKKLYIISTYIDQKF